MVLESASTLPAYVYNIPDNIVDTGTFIYDTHTHLYPQLMLVK